MSLSIFDFSSFIRVSPVGNQCTSIIIRTCVCESRGKPAKCGCAFASPLTIGMLAARSHAALTHVSAKRRTGQTWMPCESHVHHPRISRRSHVDPTHVDHEHGTVRRPLRSLRADSHAQRSARSGRRHRHSMAKAYEQWVREALSARPRAARRAPRRPCEGEPARGRPRTRNGSRERLPASLRPSTPCRRAYRAPRRPGRRCP